MPDFKVVLLRFILIHEHLDGINLIKYMHLHVILSSLAPLVFEGNLGDIIS